MFKNTVKLMVSNFPIAWKVLVYKLLAVGITIGLFCASLGHLATIDAYGGFTSSTISFLNVANIASTPAEIMLALSQVVESFAVFFLALASSSPLILAYLLLVIFVIFPYLWHLGDLAGGEGIFGFMSSQTKYGFFESLIRNLPRANAYSWTVTLLVLPCNLLFLAGVMGLVILGGLGGIWLVLAPALLVLWATIYFSLRTIVLSSWAGAITTTSAKTWTALKYAFRAISRNFLVIWTNALAFIVLFAIFGVLTGVIGCVIMLPVFCFIISVFGLVVFFEHRGMRYYVDFETIITPKKLEQTDKLSKLKFLI